MTISEFQNQLFTLSLEAKGLQAMLYAVRECIENGSSCAEDYAPALFVICNVVGEQAKAITELSATEVTL